MPLTSGLFKDDDQLQKCANVDSAHIVADEPPLRRGVNDKGPHIALIHRALRQILPAPNFGLEEPTETYGPKTAELIRQFKAAHKPSPILNKALGQTVPDNIIGIQTIAALDDAVRRNKKQPPGGGRGGPANSQPFTVVPFNETKPFLISQQKDNRNEDDLDFTKRAPVGVDTLTLARIGLLRTESTFLLERRMLGELATGGQTLALNMGNIFIQNNVARRVVPFNNDSSLSRAVRTSLAFTAEHVKMRDRITAVFKASIAARKVVDFNDLAEPLKAVTPPSINFSLSDRVLKFAVGGTKGSDVFLSNFDASVLPRRWKGTLTYDIFDHFGINDDDTVRDRRGHGSDGQVAMWVMQHERHPGHFAFIPRITVVIDVEGVL